MLMSSIPRIITVDPSGGIAHQVRSAVDLMDRWIVQVDTPSANHALDELKRGECHAVISVWEPGDQMQGWALAAEVRKIAPQTAVIILAEYTDTVLDEETLAASPFIYLQRPFEPAQFLRVLRAALDGEDIFEAAKQPTSTNAPKSSMGPVPAINLSKAQSLVDGLLRDLNAMAVLLVARDGEILLERGTIGYINRDQLSETLLPVVMTNIDLKDTVGGNATTLQFYDGDVYDVFVLSIGFHHFICIIFDGQLGSRQFGAVNRFGRRTAEDLIALLGAEAWLIRRVVVEDKPEEQSRSKARTKPTPQAIEEEFVELAPAEGFMGDATIASRSAAVESSQQLKLETIPEEEFNLDDIFGADMGGVDETLFDPDSLADLVNAGDQQGMITQEDAIKLGIIKSS